MVRYYGYYSNRTRLIQKTCDLIPCFVQNVMA